MANLTLRLVKGVPLTNAEVDGNFSNLNISKVEIGRDLSGNIYYPVVSGIQGRDVSNTAPSDAQVLKWSTSGNAWAPATISYDTLNNPPVANIILTGDVTGSANAVLTANSTIITISATTIQANSVALGTDTTGDYVANVLAGTGIVVTGQGGETASPTVALDVSGVTANTYGGSSKVPVLTIDQYGRVTAAANVNVAGVTSFAASGNSFTISTADGGSFTANIQQDSVRLGTDTTGNYVSTVTVGSGLTVTGTSDEGNVVTVAHADTSSVSNVASDNSDGTVIQDISLGFDTFGHVTSASVATVNLDSRFVRLSTASLQTVTGPVNFEGNITFAGNVTTIAANNLIITDNFIYLNDADDNSNIDFGFVGNYNDGTYQHAGFFRDASDNGTWKVFEGYLPEPDAAVDIDTSNASFRLANLAVNTLFMDDIVSLRGTRNFIVGANAAPNIIGEENFIYGNCAGYSANTASQNFIFGYKAGQCLTDVTGYSSNIPVSGATQNFIAGYCAGANLTTQSHNIMIGFAAGMCANAGGGEPNTGYNTFIGYATGAFYTGDCGFCGRGDNVFIGRGAGLFATGGANNNFLGATAGRSNSTGCFNNFLGSSTGYCNTTGNYNNFLGKDAGFYNTSGSNNNFLGGTAGYNSTSGSNNNFFGAGAGYSNCTGSHNNFLGRCAGRNNTTGCYNFFAGLCSGYSNVDGINNIFIGNKAGFCNTSGACNVFLGDCAGYHNLGGSENIYIGRCAGFCVSENEYNNTIIGSYKGPGLGCSFYNTVVIAAGACEKIKVDTNGNLTVQGGLGNVLASQGFFNNLVVNNVSEYIASTVTFSTTTESTLFEFSKDVYSSGKFTITGKQGSNVQISEMLVAQDGTIAAATEYGVVKTSNVTVFTGNVDISNSNIRIRVIGGSAISTKYTLAGTLLVL